MVSSRHIASTCLMQKTRRAARQLTSIYEEAFSGLDLTGGQFSILVALSVAGPASITMLAEALGMDRTTLSRGLGPLERRGLITFQTSASDSRAKLASLTPRGDALLDKAKPLWQEAQEKVQRQLTQSAQDQLQAALRVLGEI